MFYYCLAFALHWAALSTYWDDLFGHDNFYFHGFGVGLSLFPLAVVGFDIFTILLRAVILGLSMGIWCKYHSNDVEQEFGRGALIVLTMPILFL